MNLKYSYWYFQSALSSKFCDDLIKYGESKRTHLAKTGTFSQKENLSKKDIKDLKKVRNSNVVWLNDQWIYNEIYPYIHSANKQAGWNFQFDYSESCQFTKYKLNQFYDWHCDSFHSPYENKENQNLNGKIRKLSITCSLSDAKDYKGGELEFRIDKEESQFIKCKEILPKGSIVVFPSFIYHRVKPVTKGTRYSLVIWNLGYPFK